MFLASRGRAGEGSWWGSPALGGLAESFSWEVGRLQPRAPGVCRVGGTAHLASVVVDDEARAPAVEVLMGAHGCLQLLQQRLVGTAARGVHGGAHVVQNAHDARGTLWGEGREGQGSAWPLPGPAPIPPIGVSKNKRWKVGGRGVGPALKARCCRMLWETP